MSPVDFSEFLSAVMLMIAIIGLLLIIVVPRTDYYARTRTLGIALFTCGLGGVAGFYFLRNPDVLRDKQEQIALALVAMVIGALWLFRLPRR